MGKVIIKNDQISKNINTFHLSVEQAALDDTIKRFWEIEELSTVSPANPDDQLAEKIFETTHFRDNSGRFVVPLLFKPDADPIFPGSYSIALRRFTALERRLSQNKDLHAEYSDFMRDYLESNHMQLVTNSHPSEGYYQRLSKIIGNELASYRYAVTEWEPRSLLQIIVRLRSDITIIISFFGVERVLLDRPFA